MALGISYIYSAPEINLNGKSNISPKADIYSFGKSFLYFT